jgi:hypothetical protein
MMAKSLGLYESWCNTSDADGVQGVDCADSAAGKHNRTTLIVRRIATSSGDKGQIGQITAQPRRIHVPAIHTRIARTCRE